MAEVYREVNRTAPPTDVERVDTGPEHGMTVLARIVYLIGGIIIALLAIRFLLSLLGANRGAGFANFIYTTSHPFVSPFFGLFNYPDQFQGHRFEWSTLVAIIVYALVMALLARLAMVGSRRPVV